MATTTIKVVADTSQAERALSSLTSSLKSLAAIGAVSALAKQFVDLADAATILSNKMRTVTNSNADAAIAFGSVIAIAKKTGLEVGAVGDLFQKVSLAGQQMGLSLSDTSKITENFTKALAVTGTVGPAATSAIYQFGQALGRGTVMFEDMKQLQESSAGTLELIAKQFGKTSAQFLKDVQAGKVGSEDLADAIKQLGDTVDPTFNNMKKTVGQSMESVKTSFIDLMQKFEDATGTFDKLAKGIAWIGDNLDVVIPLAAGLIGAFAAVRIAAIVAGLVEMAVAIRTIGTTAAIAEALATGGLSAIAAAAGATAAYFAADKLFADMEKNTALKKQADEANRLGEEAKKANQEVNKLEYKGPKLDMASLKQSAAEFGLQTRLATQLAGLGKNRQEQEKAVAEFAKEQKVAYEKIANTQAAGIIRADIAARQRAEAMANAQSDLLTQKAEALALSQQDSLEALRIMTYDKLRLQYGDALSQRTKDQIADNAIIARSKQIAAEITKDELNSTQLMLTYLLDINTKSSDQLDIDQRILQARLSYGTALGADLENQIRVTEENRKQLDYYKQMKSNVDALTASTGAKAGAAASGQLGSLLPEQKAIADRDTMYNGLNELRNQDLINEEQYQTARMNAEFKANAEILSARQNSAEAQMKAQGVTNTAIIDMVKGQMAAVQMIQQGGVVGVQGVFQGLTNALGTMSGTSKKAFEMHKKMAIAQALISTYQAAAMSIALPPGPPFSLIYVASAILAGMAQVAQIKSQQFSGRALGGPVMGGTPYLVGENGPEVFTPTNTGSITRNGDLGNTQAVNVNFTINAVDGQSVDTLLVQRRGLITQIINDAMMERGRRAM